MRVDVDNGPKTLKVDLVCNWRLDDGKVMFIEADLTNWDVEALVTSIRDMAVVQWTDSLNKDRESCLAILK
jgi:hypothetical protein